ncbi:MAG: hypothetical protein H7319_20610 [Spirosoma sp.]|nr:hypothetical protein [Spirosoma sp.]
MKTCLSNLEQPITTPDRLFPAVTLETYSNIIPHMDLSPLYRANRSRYFAFCENHNLLRQVMRKNPETCMSIGTVTATLTEFITEVNQLVEEGMIARMPG